MQQILMTVWGNRQITSEMGDPVTYDLHATADVL